ncbi:hypothetical protein [Bradyrhizobium sp. JYMT SZCCT0180]|uniref:hypothetical protein n=1 Tax=Bradyrhizobium sp. JYMT SZCCT0180 TaxID=2807666 RepID=UPI001BAC405A|nr:hypothetical protein [Bradyrhizobium sp. JYMT SZCCT0180]MBR1212908.1 hypothetical protein [Bradyrhizobium sp. JYMT SZCCT0180]
MFLSLEFISLSYPGAIRGDMNRSGAISALQWHYARMPNQIASAIMAATIAAPTTGVTFFELPLRGELLAAWLNSVFITSCANEC